MRMQRYTVDLIFKNGSDMHLADTLSRAYLQEETPSTYKSNMWGELADDEQLDDLRLVASPELIQKLERNASADPEYQGLKHQIIRGWPTDTKTIPDFLKLYATFADELTVAGPFVFKGSRVVVPFGARDDVIARLHKSHNGTNGCLRRARETVYFPGISNVIKQTVSQCSVCQRHLLETSKLPLQSHPTPSRPWQRVGTDIFTQSGIDYLVCVDYLSGYFEIDRLPSKSSKDVVYALRQQFARHGIPDVVISDNSPFGSEEFSEFARKWEFVHKTSSPNYAQSNGRAENAVKTAKRLMKKAAESNTDPLLALLEWRNTPTETSEVAPTQVMFGRRTRTLLPTTAVLLEPQSQDTVRQAETAMQQSKERQASYYNKGAKEREDIREGQTVRTKFADHDWRKGEVVKSLPDRSYVIEFQDGSKRRRTLQHIRASSEKPITRDALDDDSSSNDKPG